MIFYQNPDPDQVIHEEYPIEHCFHLFGFGFMVQERGLAEILRRIAVVFGIHERIDNGTGRLLVGHEGQVQSIGFFLVANDKGIEPAIRGINTQVSRGKSFFGGFKE